MKVNFPFQTHENIVFKPLEHEQLPPRAYKEDERVRERKDKVNAVETLGYDRLGCYRLDYGSRIDFVVA
jgi:hypothetical protein